MKKTRFTENQIVAILNELEAGMPVPLGSDTAFSEEKIIFFVWLVDMRQALQKDLKIEIKFAEAA